MIASSTFAERTSAPTMPNLHRSRCSQPDMKQLNSSFFVNVSTDQGSERSSLIPMDNGVVDVVSSVVPNVRASLGLQQSQVITQKFNEKWKVGRSWLYYSKPPSGPLAGIMKC